MPKHDSQGALLRDLRRSRHYTIDNEFLDDGYGSKIGPIGIAAYNILCRCANIKTSSAFPSYQTISSRTGMSISSAKRAIKLLLKYHLISYSAQIGRGHSNEYYLLDSSEWLSLKHDTQSPFNNINSVTETPFNNINSVTETLEKVSQRTTNNLNEQTNNNNNNRQPPRKADPPENGNGRCCCFSDESLTALMTDYRIQEPKIKLIQMIQDFHITQQTELEKGLQVAHQRVTHHDKLLSYARKLFTQEGMCLENPESCSSTPQYDHALLQRLREVLP